MPHLRKWKPEQVAIAEKRIGSGVTYEEIATELSVTRAAVASLAKRHQLKLAPGQARPKPKPAPPRPRSAGWRPRRIAPLPAIDETRGEPKSGVSFMELWDKSCRFPIGTPRDHGFFFCGEPQHDGLPYCPYHCRRAYTTTPGGAMP